MGTPARAVLADPDDRPTEPPRDVPWLWEDRAVGPFHGALVGRDDDLAALSTSLEAAFAGLPSLTLIGGEAGIGKSRLVEELLTRARGRGALVAVGRCSAAGPAALPYSPFMEVVERLVQALDEHAVAPSAQVLRSVAPLLRDGAATATDPFGSDLALPRMYAGVAETIALTSAIRPLLLVIEDAHWADRASLGMLDFVARRLQGRAVMLVVTFRTGDRMSVSNAGAVLSELLRLPDAVEIALAPLKDDAIDALLAELPSRPDASTRHRICDLCDGNPFFALHLAAQNGRGRGVSPALREALLAPSDELDADAREVLLLLAVLGRETETGLVGTSLDWPDARVLRALRALFDHGLLATEGRRLGLRHALLREAVLEDALPSERILAHYRAANGLLAEGAAAEPERAGELSVHLLESGRNADAVRFALAGARHAAAVWAFEDAGRLYGTVLRLWPFVVGAGLDGAAEEDIEIADILIEAAGTHRWSGAHAQSLDLLAKADALPDLTTPRRARIARTRGHVLWAMGEADGSLAAFTEAARLLEDPGESPVLGAGVLAALALGQMFTGRAAAAEGTARRAIELADRAGAVAESLDATITLAVSIAQQGDAERSAAMLAQCLPRARELDELQLVVRCYGNLTFVLNSAGRYDEVDRVAREGEEVCHRYGPILSVASTVVNNHISALVYLGRWDEARELARQAFDEALPTGIAIELHLTLAEVAAVRGEPAEAERHLSYAPERGARDPYTESSVLIARCELLLWADDPAGALALVDAALPSLAGQDDAFPVLHACWHGSRAAADLARGARSRTAAAPRPDLLEAARAAADGSTSPGVLAMLAMCEAETARAAGDQDPDGWLGVAGRFEQLRRPYLRAYALYRAAEGLARRRAVATAAAALRDARAVAERLGCAPLLAAADELARRAKLADPAPTGAPSPFGLTPREVEVLGLLATGATNREIARALFISARTAGVHVSNILAKLGVTNRTEAATTAHEIGLGSTPREESR